MLFIRSNFKYVVIINCNANLFFFTYHHRLGGQNENEKDVEGDGVDEGSKIPNIIRGR